MTDHFVLMQEKPPFSRCTSLPCILSLWIILWQVPPFHMGKIYVNTGFHPCTAPPHLHRSTIRMILYLIQPLTIDATRIWRSWLQHETKQTALVMEALAFDRHTEAGKTSFSQHHNKLVTGKLYWGMSRADRL